MKMLSVLLQVGDYYSQGYNAPPTLEWVKLIILIVVCICFGIVAHVKRKAKKEGRNLELFPALKMSKGFLH